MVRMLLPLEMGNIGKVVEHPILLIGTGYALVKPEIRQWMVDTLGFCHTGCDCGKYFVDFKTDEDMALFMMKWL